MTPSAFLLTHFDRLAEAPGGLAKLRALLLHLAIQGKLDTQNPKDESAETLLVKFSSTAKTQRRVNHGDVDSSEPFELPSSWAWVRLPRVLNKLTDGTHHSPANGPAGDFKYVTAKNIKDDGILLSNITYVAREVHEEIYSRCDPSQGDILYIKDGATTGIATINQLKEPFSMLSSVALLKPSHAIYNRYLLWAMRSPFFYAQTRDAMKGAAITRVTLSVLSASLLPLPPLAEQRRIVAKVEELMCLCDALEAAQREREAIRTRLRTSALHQLASPDSDTKSAAFVLRNLPHFTTEPEALADIRQSVLQLAVQGRLLKQNLTEKISPELSDRLNLNGNDTLEAPHDIPSSWCWSSIAAVAAKITDGEHLSPAKAKEGVMLLTAKHIRDDSVSFENPQFVSPEDAASIRVRCDPQRDDILICSRGTIGRCALVETDTIFCLMGSVILIRLPKDISPRFLLTFLRTDWAQQAMRGLSGATAVSALYLKDIRKCPIPLPPLAEQRRIVAKVDELMAVLDALEATLTTARTTSENLLAATIAKLHAA